MKTAIIISGLGLTFLLSGLVGQTPTPALPTEQPYNLVGPLTMSPGYQVSIVTMSDELHGIWLTVQRHNSKAKTGFDPCYTDISSDFRPVVTKDGAKWRIIFESQDLTTEFQP